MLVAKGGKASGGRVICFFCLRQIPAGEANVVVINDRVLGMKFRVFACSECLAKHGRYIEV